MEYDLTATPLFSWAFFIAAGVAAERHFAGGRRIASASAVSNAVNGFLVCVMELLLKPVIAFTAAVGARRLGAGLVDMRGLGLLAVPVYIFIYDFIYYFWHRAEHRFGFLWDMHAVHHSDTAFNVTTYVRQHWLEMFFQALFIVTPMAVLFRFTPLEVFAANFLMTAVVFFSHMDLRLDMGRLTGIITGPQYHRLHHSALKEDQDVNFVQFFPVIDRLFSTRRLPGKGEYPPTGLYSGETVEGVKALFMRPFFKWARRIGKMA
jgi:sterol desaturase/sphingolipid hydroxylase (fatty acid hydroxylase superfamily)